MMGVRLVIGPDRNFTSRLRKAGLRWMKSRCAPTANAVAPGTSSGSRQESRRLRCNRKPISIETEIDSAPAFFLVGRRHAHGQQCPWDGFYRRAFLVILTAKLRTSEESNIFRRIFTASIFAFGVLIAALRSHRPPAARLCGTATETKLRGAT
jgi:hypothetical protein